MSTPLERKRRLIWQVSLLLIAGFVSTSLVSYFYTRSSLRSQITTSELPLTSDNIYSEIQRDLLRPIFISSLMANDTFLRDWIIGGEKGTDQISKYLREIKTQYHTLTSFFVSEKTGRYYHSDGILKTVQADEPRDSWYFRVRNMTAPYEINVDPDMANRDTMTIFINYRVFDYNGNYIGATGVGLAVSSVKALIHDYQTRYQRDVFFVNPTGQVMLHGPSFDRSHRQLQKMPGLAAIAGTILSKNANSFVYQRGTQTVLLNTRFIPEFQWYLLVEQTETTDFTYLLRTMVPNLLICLAITAVVLLLTHWTIRVYQQQLERLATIDKLTRTYNRHAFDGILKQALHEANRTKAPLSLILMDLDHFKKINDQYGHLSGDAALHRTAQLTRQTLRAADAVCRWGGEEFIILLKGCRLTDAAEIAQKIRHQLETTPIPLDEQNISLTASFGVTRYRAGEGEDNLISRADRQLYKAKNAGRNRVCSDP